jgi:hypothetical protein
MKFGTSGEALQALRMSRGKAIEAYASIEESQCAICADLLSAPPDYAGIMFFKITSARARNRAVDGLLSKRFGNTYNLFWNALLKRINQLDQRRNEIVHWQTINEVGYEDGVATHEYKLTPPNIWDMKPTTPFITSEDIDDFCKECDFLMRSMNMFRVTVILTGVVTDPVERQTWLDIFQQALVYPPPSGHPLSQT